MTGEAQQRAAAAILRERETRHWTINQWRQAALKEGRDDWPFYSAEVTVAADEAVDVLLAALAGVPVAPQHRRAIPHTDEADVAPRGDDAIDVDPRAGGPVAEEET